MSLQLFLGANIAFPDVYARPAGSGELSKKKTELFQQLELLTEEKFNENNWVIDRSTYLDDGAQQCTCSKRGIYHVFVIKHVPTGKKALLGSECIHEFNNEELSKDVNAHVRDNKCDGGNIIRDLRTKEGRQGLCGSVDCRCAYPKCVNCEIYKDECTCPKCEECRAVYFECKCPQCYRCVSKIKKDGSCKCEICDWCEKFPFVCSCKKCNICRKVKQACKCKKCKTCKKSATGMWQDLCNSCYYNQRFVECHGCDEQIPEHKYKKFCRSCFINN